MKKETLKEKIIEILREMAEDGTTYQEGYVNEIADQIIELFEEELGGKIGDVGGFEIAECNCGQKRCLVCGENPENIGDWEKKFDEEFLAKENKKQVVKTGLSTVWAENIKSFIRNLLKKKDQEYLKKIEGLRGEEKLT